GRWGSRFRTIPSSPRRTRRNSEDRGTRPSLTRWSVTCEHSGSTPIATPLPPRSAAGSTGGGSSQYCDRFWTIDPIDGTKGFLRNEQYAVALALIVEGQVVVAVLSCPN